MSRTSSIQTVAANKDNHNRQLHHLPNTVQPFHLAQAQAPQQRHISAMSESIDANHIARAAAKGTLFSFLLRVLSFSLSQITLRLVDATTLGKAAIQLELLLSTCLFLSREGFRLALINAKNTSKDTSVENVAWLSVPLGSIISMLILFLHHFYFSSESTGWDYQLAGSLYAVGALIECLSEPVLILTMRTLSVSDRAAAEGFAVLVKAITTVLLLILTDSTYPISAFGLSQLAYGLTVTSTLYWRMWDRIRWPKKIVGDDGTYNESALQLFGKWPIDFETLRLVGTFTAQGIFKHALTEGDKIVLSAVADGYDQGVYAMTCSYGGLASRMLLQPLEENGRLLFALLKNTDDKNELRTCFVMLLKLVLYIGLFFVCIASNYTEVLLRILAGSRWANDDATEALSAFCLYTGMLAINGMSEAFVYAVVSSNGEIGSLTFAHATIGVVFAASAPLFVQKRGTIGLIAANSLQMLLRCIFSFRFAAQYFTRTLKSTTSIRDLMRGFLPRGFVLFAFFVSYVATWYSKILFTSATRHCPSIFDTVWVIASFKHIAVGLICISLVVATALRAEYDLMRYVKSMRKVKTT